MKELNPIPQDNTAIIDKIHADIPKGNQVIPRGCKMWEINPFTEEVNAFKPKVSRLTDKEHMAKVKKLASFEPHSEMTHHKVEYNPRRYYCFAINKYTALIKFHKSKCYASLRRSNPPQSNPS